ncbi:hypothetical protein [Rubrivirga sp. IMCC45206]|uniref:hypothetical protein n=1 Tax=Rubrivirga sp. IMCC45206 TaxID=3391614 RepID=UPI00398F9145
MLALVLSALAALAAPVPPAGAEAPPPILRFVNGTAHEVTALYIADCGAQDYWDNLLDHPSYGWIVPGATVEFRVPPGCYDLHATLDLDPSESGDLHQLGVSVDDDVLHQWRIELDARGRPRARGTAPRGRLGVIEFSNRSRGLAVTGLFLAECGSDWGGDELDGVALVPGDTITMDVEPGCWDMYARLRNGRVVDTEAFTVQPGQTTRRWVNDRHAGR